MFYGLVVFGISSSNPDNLLLRDCESFLMIVFPSNPSVMIWILLVGWISSYFWIVSFLSSLDVLILSKLFKESWARLSTSILLPIFLTLFYPFSIAVILCSTKFLPKRALPFAWILLRPDTELSLLLSLKLGRWSPNFLFLTSRLMVAAELLG